MTICFISDGYPGAYFGGIAIYTQRLARALVHRGHCVHVIARDTMNLDLDDQGVQVHFRRVRWIPLLGRFLPGLGESIGLARALRTLDRLFHFEVVEFPNWEGLGLVSARLLRMPTVARLHTSVLESWETAGRHPTQAERFLFWAEKSSVRSATAVLTHSEAHARHMAAAYGIHNIKIIPHGVPIPESFQPSTTRNVLSIGRMDSRKAMHVLIDAIPRILEKVPDATFNLVGVDESNPRAQAFRARFPGITGVRFLRFVDEARLRDLFNECAIYASPAIYESFGLTFAEAMAHGRPVVGCATGGVPEIVRHQIDGLLVQPGNPQALADAIIILLEDDELRSRIGVAARQRAVDCFSIDLAAERVETYLTSIAQIKSSRQAQEPPKES